MAWRSGGYADYARDDFITGGGLGAFAELNRQLQNSPLVPFVGTSVGFELIEVDTGFNSDSENAVEFGLSLGFKYFLSSAVAIDSRYQFQAATADIYPEEDGLGGIDHKLVFGIRAFFK